MKQRGAHRVTSIVLEIAAAIVCALPLAAAPAAAKSPGSEYCYRAVCRRVMTLSETAARLGERRMVEASHYDDWRVDRYNTGTLTSDGEKFDAASPARAASANLPDGTEVLVRNPMNGRASHLRINDFGPFLATREIDVTRRVAEDLGFAETGVTGLELYVIAVPAPWDTVYRRNRRILDPRGYLGVIPERAVPGLVADLVRERQPVSVRAAARPNTTPLTAVVTPRGEPLAERQPLLPLLAPKVSITSLAPRPAGLVGASRQRPRDLRPVAPRLARLAAADPRLATLTSPDTASIAVASTAPRLTMIASWSEEQSVVAAVRGPIVVSLALAGAVAVSTGLLALGVARRRTRLPAPLTARPKDTQPLSTAMPATFASIIGPEMAISGHVTAKTSLLVQGALRGSIRAATLEIAPGASIDAAIEAKEVTVFGRVTGAIRADRVRIETGAVVRGCIEAQSLSLAAGADVEADIATMLPPARGETVVLLPAGRTGPRVPAHPSIRRDPANAGRPAPDLKRASA